MQFGQWPEQQSSPRGRWYLNEREKTRWPAAKSAEPIVSPAKAGTARAAEREGELLRAVEELVGPGRQPHCVPRNSFVRVSRSAVNHDWQPSRWYHHSRCGPAALRRK